MMGFNFGPAAAASVVGGAGLPMDRVLVGFSTHPGLAPAAALGVAAIVLVALGMLFIRRSCRISGQVTSAEVRPATMAQWSPSKCAQSAS